MHFEIMIGRRKALSLNEKRRLLDAYDKPPITSQPDAAVTIPQAILCSVLN